VEEVINRIVEETDPKMIIIFGSVARGEAKDDSDLDLLVVYEGEVDERELHYRIKGLFIGLRLASDIIVMSEEKFERFKNDEFSFTHEIASTGKVVYAQ
jgi:predicted nucleotidyltransferase